MRIRTLASLMLVALAAGPLPTLADGLQVSPVTVEIAAPGATATLKLRNDGTLPIEAQIRVFRWSQVDGQERLTPTTDVVASPPSTSLQPRTDYTIRIVRVSRQPVAAAESYRLLVDELPSAAGRRNGTVSLVLRYSIPVFFYARDASEPAVGWSVERAQGRLYLASSNRGDRHVRIAALTLQDERGTRVSLGDGLVGYVLGRSAMRWPIPATSARLLTSGSLVVTAQGNRGPIHAVLPPQPPR